MQAEQDPYAARRHLSADAQTVGVHLLDGGQDAHVVVAAVRASGERHRQRASAAFGHRPQRVGLAFDVEEIGHDLEHAGTEVTEGVGDADQLVATRRQ